ncbi:hypothetical protein CRUP_022538 [Coryphaenoides rupestris]|nr:hypothetical protein CRUP_022538 [Coryphaenoides rupestris]
MECCGWTGLIDWTSNMVIINSSQLLFPCSCHNGCSASVEAWLVTNVGVVLGICLAVAVLELLGMILSICLCKKVRTEYYTKVSKY